VFWLENTPPSGLTSARKRCCFSRGVVANRAESMDASMDVGGARDAAGGFPEITTVI